MRAQHLVLDLHLVRRQEEPSTVLNSGARTASGFGWTNRASASARSRVASLIRRTY
jgi:hypothetical protein